jgi:hypothetical protein
MTEIVFDHEDFDFETLEEEIRVDEQCRNLLHQFYVWMQRNELTPERASELVYCVDYYLRDYLLDFLRENPLRPKSGQVGYFAANWYITRTLEPEMTVLKNHLEGLVLLYTFFHELGLISADNLSRIVQEAGERDYYQKRIEAFLALAGEGYEAWDKECPLNTVERGIV